MCLFVANPATDGHAVWVKASEFSIFFDGNASLSSEVTKWTVLDLQPCTEYSILGFKAIQGITCLKTEKFGTLDSTKPSRTAVRSHACQRMSRKAYLCLGITASAVNAKHLNLRKKQRSFSSLCHQAWNMG
jgi:hypothetical protein